METDIYLLTGLEDFNFFFSSLVSKGPSAPSFFKIAVSFSHFLITKTKKKNKIKQKMMRAGQESRDNLLDQSH